VIAAYAIKTSGLPTLVIVPTERILKTWITALARFGLRATAYYGREFWTRFTTPRPPYSGGF
jgi:superfamily II DNA or RNA helicase